jgi:diacylglycerol O-acyltransferase
MSPGCVFAGQPEVAGRPGVPGIFRTVEERLHLVPRYRQRVQMVPFGLAHPVWVDDPDFDLAYHLRRLALPSPGGMQELLEVVARIHARPLDRSRPLWEMYIIEGLEGDRVAVYAKTHHAMVDGISSVDVATVLMDFDPQGAEPTAVQPFTPPPLRSGAELVQDVVRETLGGVLGAAGGAVSLAGALVTRPTAVPGALFKRVTEASRLGELLGLLRPAPASPLNVPVGGARRVALESVKLARVKAVKNALGGTVNDVVLAAVGEAIHAFLVHRGEDVPEDLAYRVMVPVSVRDETEKMALGNRVSAMFVDLPVGRMAARKRLQMVSQEMKDLKEQRQAVAADQLVDLTSWAPATLHSLAGRLEFSAQRLVNLVVSNVPGIQVPVYAGGAQLLEAYPLLPVGANMGAVVCVTSYNGGMYFGVVGDYDELPDLEVLALGLKAGVESLERAAGVRAPKRVARKRRGRATSTPSRTQVRAAARQAAAQAVS